MSNPIANPITNPITNPIERMFDALSQGDVPAMLACFTPDARIWHCFDGIAQDLDAAASAWQGVIGYTKSRYVEAVHRQVTADGFVQQHVFGVVTPNDERKAWRVCVVVKIEDGLISRFEEYIDRAGSFAPD